MLNSYVGLTTLPPTLLKFSSMYATGAASEPPQGRVRTQKDPW